jgi:epsilon-lactone hydrolase
MILAKMVKLVTRILAGRVDVAKSYQALNRGAELFAKAFLPVPRSFTITPVDAGGVPAEWFTPDGPDSGRRVLYLHGGGYVLFSTVLYRDLIWRIARAANARVLAINYRLAPGHPYPAAVDDALAAYRWLLKSGVKPQRLAVMGDSAGGGLTFVLLQKLRDNKLPLPACAVCLSPWTDLTMSNPSHRENVGRDPMMQGTILRDCAAYYAGTKKPSDPGISPQFGRFAKLPPLLIQAGTEEVLLDDSRVCAEKAAKAGTKVDLQVWPGMIHDFQMWAKVLPDARKAIRGIGRFVATHIP